MQRRADASRGCRGRRIAAGLTALVVAAVLPGGGSAGSPAAAAAARHAGSAVATVAGPAAPAPAARGWAAPGRPVAGRFLVQLRPDAAAAEVAADAGVDVERRFRSAVRGFVADTDGDEGALRRLRADPRVVGVEPDRVIVPTDVQTAPPWGLDRIDQRQLPLDGEYRYPAAGGAGVTAYVVDSGVAAAHTTFTGRVSGGFDAFGEDATRDCLGHGTHVAGTLAGAAHGVAKQVRVVSVRVFDCTGAGTASGAIAGLDYVVADHRAGEPAVANLSLSSAASPMLDAAVQRAIDDGVSVVVSAGNDAGDACARSPARVADAVTVGATDRRDARASFSSYGSCVDLFAPGVDVMSAGIASTTAEQLRSGTSMAAPHVAGVAARHLARYGSAAPSGVAAALVADATTGVVTGAGAGSPNLLLHAGAQAATALTATAAPAWVDPGQEATLTGVLTDAGTGSPLPGRNVEVAARVRGTEGWTSVGAADTDADGRVTVPVRPAQTTEYRLRHPGTAATAPSTSAIVSVPVGDPLATVVQVRAPAAINYGDTVGLSARLVRPDGAAVAGGDLELSVRRQGTTAWRVLTTRATDAGGTVAYSRSPLRNVEYRVRHPGSDSTRPSRRVTAVEVRFAVGAELGAATATVGDRVRVSGRLTPGRAVAPAEVQIVVNHRPSGRWTSRTVGYRDDGSFAALLTFDQAGEHRVQAIAHGDGVRATGASRPVSLTVGCPQPPSPVPPGSGCEVPSTP